MAAVFLLLNQEGFGPKRYGLKGTEMLEQLGLTCRRVEHPDHPNNHDYEITIPAPDAARPERPAAAPAPSQPQPAAPAAPSEEAAVPPPPERWQGSVFFHFKTQAILAGFLGEAQLSQDELAQIARDYDAARLAGRVQWLPGKHCYSVPLSLRSKEGRYTLLSIKVNDFPGGPPWRVNFVGFRRPEPEEQARDSLTSQPAGAAVPAPEPPEAPSGAEASAEEITAPAFNRLSDRDKLEIYNILLPLNPVGVPVLLSVASSTLANHGITPQRYGYARVLQLVSDMPEYFRITSVQPQPGAPLVYSLTLLPLPGDGVLCFHVLLCNDVKDHCLAVIFHLATLPAAFFARIPRRSSFRTDAPAVSHGGSGGSEQRRWNAEETLCSHLQTDRPACGRCAPAPP